MLAQRIFSFGHHNDCLDKVNRTVSINLTFFHVFEKVDSCDLRQFDSKESTKLKSAFHVSDFFSHFLHLSSLFLGLLQ